MTELKLRERRDAPVYFMESVDSTNTRLKELARQGAPHGTVVAALGQTGGRGRLGRSFASPPGGLYLSILWRPDFPPEKAARLSCAGALAASAAIEEVCGISPNIKWPNDLLLNGKKISGILTEAAWQGEGRSFVIVGTGINVNTEQFPEGLKGIASSLYLETGRSWELERLAAAFIARLDSVYQGWGEDGGAFIEEYRRRCITPGRDILIDHEGGRTRVHALSVEDDYSLLIRWPDGKTEKKSFGEISQLV